MNTETLVGKTYNYALHELGVAPYLYENGKLVNILDENSGERIIQTESEAMVVEDLAQIFKKDSFQNSNGEKAELPVSVYEEKRSFCEKHPYFVKTMGVLAALAIPAAVIYAATPTAQASSQTTIAGIVTDDYLDIGNATNPADDVYTANFTMFGTSKLGQVVVRGFDNQNLSALEEAINEGDFIKFDAIYQKYERSVTNFMALDLEEIGAEEFAKMVKDHERGEYLGHVLCVWVPIIGISIALDAAYVLKKR